MYNSSFTRPAGSCVYFNVFLNVSAAVSNNRKGKGELLQAPHPDRVGGTSGETCGLDIRRL